jgi:hypothetical protein
MLPAGASPEAEETAALRRDPISNFVAEVRVTSHVGGFVSRAGVGRKVAQENFRFAGGLGLLFLGGGKPVRSTSPYASTTARVLRGGGERCAYGGLEAWGRGGWSGDERREGASLTGAGSGRVQVLLPVASGRRVGLRSRRGMRGTMVVRGG